MQLHALVANAVHVLQIFANGIMLMVLLSKINIILSCKWAHTHLNLGFFKLYAIKMVIRARTAFCVHVISYCSSVVL